MLSIEDMRTMLQDRRVPVVAQRTGLSPSTIYAIRDGRDKNPTIRTVEKLSAYLGAS